MADITQFVGYGFDRGGQKIIAIILHDSAGGDAWPASQWLAYWKSQAISDNPTSAHVTVLRDGAALFCVPDTLASAGAGYGVVLGYNQWNPAAERPEPNLNRACINIEIVAPKAGPVTYPAPQLATVERICRDYLARYPGIVIYSHAEVDRQAVAQGYSAALAHHDPRDFDMGVWRAKFTLQSDDIRNAAFNAAGIAYNPQAAFPRYARLHDLGAPLTGEFNFTGGDGAQYSGQGFVGGIVYCVTGRWSELKIEIW